MKQRAIIPIVAASRTALKGLVDHSFEGVNYGNDSLKKFSELNLRSGALVVESYAPNGYSNPGFADLMVAKGTLNDGGVTVETNESNTLVMYNYKMPANTTALKFKAAKAGDKADDALRTIAAWGAANCEAVAPGNQLTFLTVSLVDHVKVGDNRAPISAFDINRLLFPSSENTPAQVDDVNGAWTHKLDVPEGSSSVVLSNGISQIVIEWDDNTLTFSVQPAVQNESPVCGGAVIRSTYVNGTWKRSNAKIVVKIPEGQDKYTYEMWRSYYESTGVSAKYLNQGKESTGIQG